MQSLSGAIKSPPAAQSCARQVLEVAPPVIRAIRGFMRSRYLSELSVPQFRALALLGRNPQVSLSAVADCIGSSLPAASRMIEALVARGFVARRQSPLDRRCVRLALTARGKHVLDDAWQATRRHLAGRLAVLSRRQQRQVASAMELLAGVFGSDAGPATPSGSVV